MMMKAAEDEAPSAWPGMAVWLSLLCSLLFTSWPVPEAWQTFWPLWSALVWLYLAVYHARQAGYALCFAYGLVLDVVLGSMLGMHAFTLLGLRYFAGRHAGLIGQQPWWLQLLLLLPLLLLYQFLTWWALASIGISMGSALFWWPLLSSLLVWPCWLILHFFLHDSSR